MTDLQQTIQMFSKTKEVFEKRKSGKCWELIITNRGISFFFYEDESFRFISNN